MIRIMWDELSRAEWCAFLRAREGNIIQSDPYIDAIYKSQYQASRLGVIYKGDEKIGVFCAQEVKLFGGLVHILNLDRGPLWLGAVTDGDQLAFWRALNSLYPRRFLRYRRVMPEREYDTAFDEALQKIGYRRRGDGYSSSKIDLTISSAEILAKMRPAFRAEAEQALKRYHLKISSDWGRKTLPLFLDFYLRDRMMKKYRGPSAAFIQTYAARAEPKETMVVWAEDAGEKIAGMLFFMHGQGATYLAGFSNARGRKTKAHKAMMLEAMMTLRSAGVKSLDTGGMMNHAAPKQAGLNFFKQSLGGQEYRLAGIYN